jgi:NitT/TauT family transport system ATP-binding protein
MLEINNLRKSFPKEAGEMLAIEDFSLAVQNGEFVCLLGPSGCGKTTVLRIIAGLETLTSGSIKLDGRDVVNSGPDRGMVFQEFALFPWRTVRKNVEFGLEIKRVSPARALANNPEILLMDEPFGALDAQTRNQMQKELLRIWSETKKTVVFVTHSVDEAVYLADRVVVLTARPSNIKEIFKVEQPRPRDRANPEFTALRKRILAELEEESAQAPKLL